MIPARSQTFFDIFKKEWHYWVAGVIFVLLLNKLYLPHYADLGGVPDFNVPYSYDGDGLFHLWMIQRVTEGWWYEGVRSGYPFGSSFYDYPGADFGPHLILKLFGILTGQAHIAFNLYYTCSFVVNFVVAYIVMRCIGIGVPLSLAGGVVFDFMPFHFLRLEHLFYTWYFSVPLFFYIGLKKIKGKQGEGKNLKYHLGIIFTLLLLSSFGVYYALFGMLVILSFGLTYAAGGREFKPLSKAIIYSSIILFGLVLNIVPNLSYRMAEGRNAEVANRTAVESEVYGFKFVQLILPRIEHRKVELSEVTKKYNEHFPLVNENSTASLGLIGSIGLIVVLILMTLKLSGLNIDESYSSISFVVLVLFMFGTIGGFGVLFAKLITPSIRAWNRISIFIGFGVIICLMLLIQNIIKEKISVAKVRIVFWLAALFLVAIGLYDQTSPADVTGNDISRLNFEYDQDFVKKIESVMPIGAAIYQFPYISSPEVPPINSIGPYTHLTGLIHSKNLKWSSGGMKGRFGDLFYRNLSQESMAKQIEIIKNLGFEGVTVDLRGYRDSGKEVLNELTTLLESPPLLKRADEKIFFFKINDARKIHFLELTDQEIMQASGFYFDKLGKK